MQSNLTLHCARDNLGPNLNLGGGTLLSKSMAELTWHHNASLQRSMICSKDMHGIWHGFVAMRGWRDCRVPQECLLTFLSGILNELDDDILEEWKDQASWFLSHNCTVLSRANVFVTENLPIRSGSLIKCTSIDCPTFVF